MSRMLKFGVFLPFYAFHETSAAPIFSRRLDTARACERLGYDSVWLDDHLMFGETPILECWTTLSALASATSKIKLGTMITSNAFRNPALLAKMAATVDVISGGRLELGIGAGTQPQEHIAYGFPFPKPSLRISQMGETAEILKKMWTQQKTTYTGKHYKIVDAVCEPKPVQKPHPTIIIGGCGEKLTLKVMAEHADRLDFGYLPTLEEYKRKLKVLEKHCQTVGRDFGEIEKSAWPAGQILLSQKPAELEQKIRRLKPEKMSREDFLKFTLAGTPDDCLARLQPYVDLGVTQFMLFFADLPDTSSLELFSEAVAKKLRVPG